MELETIDVENNGASQAINIPANFKINDNKVYIKRMGNGLFIIPYHEPWESLFDSLQQFSTDFMEDRNQPHCKTENPLINELYSGYQYLHLHY